jgi:adenosylcobinamide-GDP ribazoletransferase
MATPAPTRLVTSAGMLTRTVRTIRAAFALLTRLPVSSSDDSSSGAAAFPLVGVVVGLAGAAPLVLAGATQPVLASLLAIAAMAILTGVLHLDGLADTADALAAPYAAAAERARTDPAVGPGGVAALVVVLATEVAALVGLATAGGAWLAAAALVVGATVARTMPVLAVQLAPGRVPDDGFAGWFARRVGPLDGLVAVVLAAAVTVVVVLATGWTAVALGGIVGAIVGSVAAAVVVSLRGQLDGDGLGAIVELTFAAALTAATLVA